jgi:hypothetical protein
MTAAELYALYDEAARTASQQISEIDPELRAALCARQDAVLERVAFTGAITDKAELYSEYAKAKIFALTSTLEGVTPNVYAEALFHGCMFYHLSGIRRFKPGDNAERCSLTTAGRVAQRYKEQEPQPWENQNYQTSSRVS